MTTSETPGWLLPDNEPVYDEELERLISRWVRAVSGLEKGRVLPRWVSKQPAQLPPETDWCGFGITGMAEDSSPAIVPAGAESAELWRHEEFECMASFYGPRSQRYITRFRDGISLSQNNDELGRNDLSVVRHSGITPFPELINNQWVRRYDITVTLRRKVIREYGIKTLTDTSVTFFGE